MRTYHPNTDPTTIPDDVLKAERARRNSAKRTTFAGGHNGGRPRCECGACKACAKREREQQRLIEAGLLEADQGTNRRHRERRGARE